MNRASGGFYDTNGEFVTADMRVEHRFEGRRGIVNAIFQDGEAESYSTTSGISIWSNGMTSAKCRLGLKRGELPDKMLEFGVAILVGHRRTASTGSVMPSA